MDIRFWRGAAAFVVVLFVVLAGSAALILTNTTPAPRPVTILLVLVALFALLLSFLINDRFSADKYFEWRSAALDTSLALLGAIASLMVAQYFGGAQIFVALAQGMGRSVHVAGWVLLGVSALCFASAFVVRALGHAAKPEERSLVVEYFAALICALSGATYIVSIFYQG